MLGGKALEALARVEQEAPAVEEEQHRRRGAAGVGAHAQDLRHAEGACVGGSVGVPGVQTLEDTAMSPGGRRMHVHMAVLARAWTLQDVLAFWDGFSLPILAGC